jgi:acyl-CoA thioester hydrolase
MAKPDPALIAPPRYPFAHTITTRFADIDPNKHINNVALAAMFEDARVRFNQAIGFVAAMEGHRAMVASIGIEYLAEGYFPANVEAFVAVEAFGRTSWTVVQLLCQGQTVVGFARSTLVCIRDDRPSPLPEAMRDGLSQWLLRG